MNCFDLHIIAIGLLVAYACTLIGVVLVVQGTALMSDAISHAVLPGIVGMFMLTHNMHSPLLIIAATASGLLTAFLTNKLISFESLREDAAIGLVFPLFFSVGIVMLCSYARTVHLDIDMVIMGEIIFAPFNTWSLMGYSMGPIALWNMSGILFLNALVLALLYKEFQICIFDPGYARTLGFNTYVLNYLLMGLTAITCVGAFDIVGSVVVVSLIIGPASCAYLLTKSLEKMIYVALGIATCSIVLGYIFAHTVDTSIAGCIATANGFLFFCVFLYTQQYKRAMQSQLNRK